MKKLLTSATLLILTIISSGNNLSFQRDVQTDQQKKEQEKIQYTCPMHHEVIQDKPGKCPKCGMDLVVLKKVEYTCPMHSEILQDKPGKCPKCGMNLVKKEAEKKPETKKNPQL